MSKDGRVSKVRGKIATSRRQKTETTTYGFKVDEDGTGDVLARTSLREEGVEGVITSSNGLVRGHLTIGLNAVLCR